MGAASTVARDKSAPDRVYEALRAAILSGKLKIGQRIAEVPLATEFQVSRAVIREALQRLAYEGLVEQNGYQGTRVVDLTPEQIDEITSVRVALEVEAIRQLQHRVKEQQKDELRAMARRLDGAAHNPQQYAQLDLALHERLWEITGNRALQRMLHQVTAPLFALGTLNRYSRMHNGQGQKSVGDLGRGSHVSLVETICEGTLEEAAEAMRLHIYCNWPVVRRSFAEFLEMAHTRPAADDGPGR